MIRLGHAGDLHPNSGATFAGKLVMDSLTGKNQSLSDLRKSLAWVREVATDHEAPCDAFLLTGDVFDTVAPTMDEVQVMVEWIEGLADRMPVLIIPGNHDMSTSGNMATALEPLKLRDNIFVMERPESKLLNFGHETVRFFSLPYPQKGRILASAQYQDKSPEEVTALINHGLASIIRKFTLECDDAVPTVLLAHGSVDNAKVGDQPRSLAHDILIPLQECLPFDFVALGHIHQPQQVGANAWYSGSLMRQSFGEEHEPKGFNVVEVTKGHPAKVEFFGNPWARKYKTLTLQDVRELGWQSISAEHIYRIKDQVNAEAYEASKPIVDKWVEEHPWTQVDLELVAEDRTRDAGMAKLMTVDEALERTLKTKVSEEEIPELMEKHRGLMVATV